MATLKDIAEMVGLSVSTISRVLSGDESINVSAEARQRITRAAETLNYRPGKKRRQRPRAARRFGLAQMLDTAQLMEDIYYLLLKNAVEEVNFEAGNEISSLFRNGDGVFSLTNESPFLDGVFAIGRFSDREIESLERLSPKLVFLDSAPDDLRYCSVVPNYEVGVRLAVERFLADGHTRIGILGGKNTFGYHKTLEEDARWTVFLKTLAAAGHLRDEYLYDCEMNSRSSYEVMSRLLREDRPRPTALFVSSDVMASGLLRALNECNVRVPDDLSVIAFNDTPISENLELSSVGIHLKANAKAAVMLMEEIALGDAVVPQKVVLSCYLRERGSTRCLR